MTLNFFDSNCYIGRSAVINPGSFYSPDELLKRMNKYGIGKSLVYHSVSRDHSPSEGNRILSVELEEHDKLYPIWVVLPHHTGEFLSPSRLETEMRQSSIKAVRIFPSPQNHNFSIKPYSSGPMFEMLQHNSVPVFVDIDQIGWDNIDILLEAYTSLPVVLCNINYRGDRYLYPLMASYPNLYIETSRFLSHLGIEALCKKIGSSRILFGSAMPMYTGSGAVYYINNLMLDVYDKERIASGNLIELLESVKL